MKRRYFSVALCLLAVLFTISMAAAELHELRLDPNVRPTSQQIRLALNANKTEYKGSVNIQIVVEKSTNAFRFHAEEMSLDRIEMRDRSNKFDVRTATGKEGIILATTEPALSPGKYTLKIDFSKPYNTHAVGLYRIEHEQQGYLFTQFEAIDARKAFPCWDEPAYKIPFQFTIDIPEDQTVVTNTPVQSETVSEAVKQVIFAETKPLPTYLLAIAAGQLESVPIKNLSVPGRVYTVKGQSHLAEVATEITAPILAEIEKYFGSSYPYEKLDLIAIPEYWPGAMENPGAITYTDRFLLIGAKTAATISQKRTLAYVTAHEIAHMWFGDLVTMKWWNDLWLNESFATWLGEKVAMQLYPEYRIDLNAFHDTHTMLTTDARPSTRQIRREVISAADIGEDSDLAYGKGSKVLGMVELWIGADSFRAGVIDYLKKHAWGNATAGDLWGALAVASGKDVKSVLSSFIEQPGAPLITVGNIENGYVKISQKRFLNYGVQAPALTWIVPIRLKYANGKTVVEQTILLDKSSMTVDVGAETKWIMPDAGAFGYYRWNVPNEMLNRIADNPLENLTDVERKAFMGNISALLGAGLINGRQYLTILNKFANQPEPDIVNTVLDNLGNVRAAFVPDELAGSFAAYVRRTLQPALNNYGLEKQKDEAQALSELRPQLIYWLGYYGRDQRVRHYAKTLAKAYVANPASIDQGMAPFVLRIAALDGDKELFQTFIQHFENAQSPTERSNYLSALGSFSDKQLRMQALDYVLKGPLYANELFTIPSRVIVTESGAELAFRWMTENYETITSKIPEQYAAFMPFFAGGCSAERLEAAKKYFAEPEHSLPGTDRNLAKVADQVHDCINLREREGPSVKAYLNALTTEGSN